MLDLSTGFLLLAVFSDHRNSQVSGWVTSRKKGTK